MSRSAHVVILAPNRSSGSADVERDGKRECEFTVTNPKDEVKRTAKPTKEEGCPAENGQSSHRHDNTQSFDVEASISPVLSQVCARQSAAIKLNSLRQF